MIKKKKREQTKVQSHFNVGTIVHIPFHDVDTMKADDKTLILIIVDIIQKKGNTCKM